MPRWGWSVSHRHDTTLKLQRHARERVIGINHHVTVILIDLCDYHVLDPALVVAMRKKTHTRLNLINAAKRFSWHSLLQRLVSFSVSFFGRQGHFKTLARRLTLKRSLKGGQQPPAPMLVFQRLVAPYSRPNVTNRTVGTQGVVNGYVFPDADPLGRT